jgi:uncharacterized protein
MNSKPLALVTGASGGIGEAIARELNAKYRLVLVARSADKLEALAQQLGGAEVIALDLSTVDAADRLHRELETRGLAVDVLVNNAGFADYGEFWHADASKLQQMVLLNVNTLTMLTRALLPGMVERKRGHVLNVASTAAFMPGPLMAVYYASKAYVLSFGEALDEELRGTGVSVTTLCPGPVESGFQARAAMEDSKLLKNPMNPLMSAAEVAKQAVSAMEANARVVIPGFNNQMLALVSRFVPRAFVPGIVKNAQARNH